MDPKSKRYQEPRKVLFLLSVVAEWLLKGKPFYWDKQPEDVSRELLAASVPSGWLSLGRAVEILRTAETAKMPGHANKGLKWIEKRWKAGK